MDKRTVSFYYGIVLIAVGIGVCIRVPYVVSQVGTIAFFASKIGVVKFCSYMLGAMLVVAGGIRVMKHKSPPKGKG